MCFTCFPLRVAFGRAAAEKAFLGSDPNPPKSSSDESKFDEIEASYSL